MLVYRKSEGTGVFLPRSNKPFSKGSGVLPRGTGVFLNHQVMDKDKYGELRNLFFLFLQKLYVFWLYLDFYFILIYFLLAFFYFGPI